MHVHQHGALSKMRQWVKVRSQQQSKIIRYSDQNLNNGPFHNQITSDHLKARLVFYSIPAAHGVVCYNISKIVQIIILNFKWFRPKIPNHLHESRYLDMKKVQMGSGKLLNLCICLSFEITWSSLHWLISSHFFHFHRVEYYKS